MLDIILVIGRWRGFLLNFSHVVLLLRLSVSRHYFMSKHAHHGLRGPIFNTLFLLKHIVVMMVQLYLQMLFVLRKLFYCVLASSAWTWLIHYCLCHCLRLLLETVSLTQKVLLGLLRTCDNSGGWSTISLFLPWEPFDLSLNLRLYEVLFPSLVLLHVIDIHL